MTIAPGIPGLEVTIEIAYTSLPEYDYANNDTDHEMSQTTVSKYIEAPAGTDFEIRTLYNEPFDPPSPIHMDIMLDGDYVQAPFEAPGGKDGFEGYRYGQATFVDEGRSITRKFRFAELKIDENDGLVTQESKRRISNIGQIVLYFYYVEHLEHVSSANVPQSMADEGAAVRQKALKERVAMGDSLTCQTSLSTPEDCAHVSYHQVKTSDNEPFASFTFHYRTNAALKFLGIIPRTPSPSPTPEPEPQDPETMTPEELRAELIRMRNEQQQNATRIKREREREDSDGTIVGNDTGDGEVEWLGTQLVKKARTGPGEGDEVVDLGE